MRHERDRSGETHAREPGPLGHDLQIESDEQKRAKKETEHIKQKNISQHPGDDINDESRVAGHGRLISTSRRSRSSILKQAKATDRSDGDGSPEREKPRPGSIARAQAEPMRLDGQIEGNHQPKAGDDDFFPHGRAPNIEWLNRRQ